MAYRGSRALVPWAEPAWTDPLTGFFDEVFDLGPLALRDYTRQTIVRVVYASSSHDAIGAWLSQYSPGQLDFGLDIEWRPNRRKGEDNLAALLQIAGVHGCILIQLQRLDWMPDSLVNFLLNRNVKLAGVGIHQDCAKLSRDFDLDVRAKVIDLSKHAARVLNKRDLKQAGISRLCLEFWEEPVSKDKRVTLSDWESEQLSREQIIYAATDAFMCYHLYVGLTKVEQRYSVSAEGSSATSSHKLRLKAVKRDKEEKTKRLKAVKRDKEEKTKPSKKWKEVEQAIDGLTDQVRFLYPPAKSFQGRPQLEYSYQPEEASGPIFLGLCQGCGVAVYSEPT